MLTTEQQALRKNRITGSRVAKLVTGSEADVLALWEIMTGRREEDDLSNVWPVYLGSHTEDLHLNWLERVWGEPITRRGEFVQSSEHEWAGVTLDGWRNGCPVEVKHVGGREPRDRVITRYYPQCQWQAYCCDAPGVHLSIIEGANEPAVTYLPRDDEHIADLVDRADAFMACVYADVQPIAGAPVTVTLPSQWRTVDLATDTPNWKGEMQVALDEWLVTVESAKRNEDAKASVKKLLPEDVGLVIAGGIQVKRAKNGAVSIRSAA
jgi:hypothetical protein